MGQLPSHSMFFFSGCHHVTKDNQENKLVTRSFTFLFQTWGGGILTALLKTCLKDNNKL